jgi:tRNA G46 methylase TrmB
VNNKAAMHGNNGEICLTTDDEYYFQHTQRNSLQLNSEKTKCMLMSRHQNAGQNHNLKIADRAFENVAQSKYLGKRATNQNLIQEEIK